MRWGFAARTFWGNLPGMGYENRLPPEGINVSKGNVLAEVFWLLAGFLLSVAALAAVLYMGGGALAARLPFAWEERLAHTLPEHSLHPEQDAALQRIADSLAQQADVPDGIVFRLRYVDDDEVNAYATLGGVIRVHRGLLERLKTENALAFIIGHEMGHIMARDVARASGGGLLVALTLSALAGLTGIESLAGLGQQAASLTLLRFSRDAERQADRVGVALVGRHYGHLGGIREVFTEIAAYENEQLHGINVPEFLRTHPEGHNREATLPKLAETLDLPLAGSTTPLPAILRERKK